MIVRVDPTSEQAQVLSFPRDLQVHIAGTAAGSISKINAAYAGESADPQRLIDTLQENFGVPIHHYVEIDFAGFKRLIDHIGGVDLWFNNAVRNLPGKYDVGLDIHELGCVNVGADQALALARSRVLQYRGPDGWETDPTSDYGRMTRQQIVIRQALKKAVKQAKDNPLQIKGLAELAAESVTLSQTIGLSDMLDLVERFKDFDPNKLLTFSLPTSTTDPDGKSDPIPNMPKAEPILNVFRGLPVNEVGPSLINITVVNGSGKEGQAKNVAGAFQEIGFKVQEPTTTDPIPRTTIYHAPGQEAYGLRVARHITGGADIKVSEELDEGEVNVVTGADFTTIHREPTPIDKMPAPGAAPGTATTGTGATTATTAQSTATTATTAPAAPPPTTPQAGYTAGQPPPGVECG
jgi:LCP family protein required for cell wall assembly